MGITNQKIYKYFWDTDPKTLDIKQHKDYIIRRIFTVGDKNAWDWALSIYKKPEIKQAITTARSLSPKDLHFFSLLFKLKPEDFRCTQPAFHQTH